MEKQQLIQEITKLKKQKNAVIVAHNYQIDEIQEIADIVGDSFALSKYCTQVDSNLIVFCGVHFMAESAKILSPEKTVLLPERDAGCPMADMVTGEALREEKKKYPGYKVVCYINTSAAVKAECDICCTSSNAVKVMRSIEEKNILFVPDQNLGRYIQKFVPEKNIVVWEGYCLTHHRVIKEEAIQAKKAHPDALLLAHPECKQEVLDFADFVGSTSQIITYAKESKQQKFIIGTEMGILHKLKQNNPEKTFYLLSQGLICPNMKKTTLESVYRSLKEEKYDIQVDEEIRIKAVKSLNEMLERSK